MRYYFDWAASAPADSFQIADIPFGNPSARHTEGREARNALEDARTRCARVLNVSPEQLFFTSGGTEANALMIHSLLLRPRSGAILCSAVEHPSARENCLILERLGKKTGRIGVEKDGRVTVSTLEKALEKHPDAGFAAIMAVNNETGAVMDIPALAEKLKKREGKQVHFHCDMVQAVGKVDIAFSAADSASLSGHKIGAPRGIGLLYLKNPQKTAPLYRGGEQENGVRPGTENVSAALALADSLERRALPSHVRAEYEKAQARFAPLIQFFQSRERFALIPEERTNALFSPYILQARIKGIPGEVLVRVLDAEGFAVSTGSACSSASLDRPVLMAMGADKNAQLEGIRISQGWTTTPESVSALIEALNRVSRTM
jgi:cysteine desulfurase